MTYTEALAYVFSLQSRGIKLDLDRVRAALRELGSPQERFPCILVAGTNGKGSTSSMLASILSRPGRKVGLFTSPHLIDYRERIRLDGELIPRDLLAEMVARDRAVWERYEVSFFEGTFALALACFAALEVDAAVLEVGLGGRLDATNVVEPVASVVTHIGRDHVHILGDDLASIAREKAGILRGGVPGVVAGGAAEAVRALEGRARELGVPLYLRPRVARVRGARAEEGGTSFDLAIESDPSLDVPLPEDELPVFFPSWGWHQVANASLAALTAWILGGGPHASAERPLPVEATEILHGLRRWSWPGRLDRPRPDLPLVADAAHNRESARAAAAAVRVLAAGRPVRLVAGMVAKKDHTGFFREMSRIAREAWISAPTNPRALPAAELAAHATVAGLRAHLCPTIGVALDRALEGAADPHGPLVFLCGSLFTLEDGYRHLGVGARERLWDPA